MSRRSAENQERLARAVLLDDFMSKLDEYVENKIKEMTGKQPYWVMQAYQNHNELRDLLRRLLNIGDTDGADE